MRDGSCHGCCKGIAHRVRSYGAGVTCRHACRHRAATATMGAGFQRDVGGGAARPRAGCAQREHFRMRLTGALMPAVADDFLAMRDDAADAWVGLGGAKPALRKA